jgi:monoamine oxidase
MQATMFQPVGGMDRIAYAFAGKLGPVVQYDAPVREIRKTANGVRIVYTQGGSRKLLEADYCICALPLAIVKSIPNDFSARIKQAIAKTEYADGFKIAWESKRFWETDFNIYGGISWVVSGPVELVWYPSARLFSEKGVLISGYSTEGDSPFGKLPNMEAKLVASRAAVERLHPGYAKLLNGPMYVNWGKIAENLGSWVAARDSAPPAASAVSSGRQPAPTAANAVRPTSYYDGPYKEFIQPDERVYFAGDHCARIGAWQEGAALAAHRAAQMIGDRVRMTRLTSRQTAG